MTRSQPRANESIGSVSGRGVHKLMTSNDRAHLEEAIGVATEILARFGADPAEVFPGTMHAGHPGETLPLTEASAPTMHDARLPENVFVADATLFPRSLGNPPILTIIAMAKRVARICTTNRAPSLSVADRVIA